MPSEYAVAAHNAVRTCMNVQSDDRVVLITDRGTADIAEALADEARTAGADVASWTMEDWVERPAREFPRRLAQELTAFEPTVSFFIADRLVGELAFRQPMLHLLTDDLRCRHGHMLGIDRSLMLDGMSVDYDEVYRVTQRLYEIVRHASRIDVTSRLGTELTATFSPERRWIPCDGRYWEQGLWGNLPEGEVFTAPLHVEGVLAGEELGDHFDRKYGLLPEPVRLHVKGERAVGVEMPGYPAIQAEIEAYLAQSPNSNRVGEFAIGTNVGLSRIVGNFLQDEKFPGVHVAFGDPYGTQTGADWSCPSHVDVLTSYTDVWADGRKIMEDGRFLV